MDPKKWNQKSFGYSIFLQISPKLETIPNDIHVFPVRDLHGSTLHWALVLSSIYSGASNMNWFRDNTARDGFYTYT